MVSGFPGYDSEVHIVVYLRHEEIPLLVFFAAHFTEPALWMPKARLAQTDERMVAVLLLVAAARSCVAAMMSSVAQSAGLRRVSVWTRLAGGSNGGVLAS